MKKQPVDEPVPTSEQPAAPAPSEMEPGGIVPVKAKHKHRRLILPGILGILLLVIIGAAIGYGTAINKRITAEQDRRYVTATTQYELALVDQREGRLASARNRIEYVISLYPQFPGVDGKLAEILLAIGTSTTPIASNPEPILTVEPTKDNRASADLLQAAQTQYANNEWEALINTVRSMRDGDPSYEVIKVDGLYYGALRNEGMNQIQKGNLEIGLYDFAIASQIAPIDTDAEAYRVWARMYLTGVSWWKISWEKVTIYFSQLNDMVPDLIDFSGKSVRQRYTEALSLWGDQLSAAGDFCGAIPKYETSAQVTNSQAMNDKVSAARAGCEGQASQTITPEATATPSETLTPVPTETPTP